MRSDGYRQMSAVKASRVCLRWLPLVVLVVLATPAAAEPLSLATLEEAIVDADARPGTPKEKWEPVAKMLKAAQIDAETEDPVLRLIAAHVYLATNRNNDSLRMFYAAKEKEDLVAWLKWAADFSTRHKDTPIAYYFRGDAAARLGRCEMAIVEYDKGLAKYPNNAKAPLLLNARGVAYAMAKELDKAREDFDAAIEASEKSLADAFVNLGSYRIQTCDGAQGANRYFTDALEHSENCVLALYGRGCVRLVLGDKKAANEDLNQAIREAPCDEAKAFVLGNAAKCVAKARGVEVGVVLADIDASGTFFKGGFTFESFERHFADGGWATGKKFGAQFGGGNLFSGGVEINPADINFDDGEWPFEAPYATVCTSS